MSIDNLFGNKPTLLSRLTYPFYRLRFLLTEKCWDLRERCQRFKRGYSYDVWNMDSWFIRTVKPMLQHFIDNHSGYPDTMTNAEYDQKLSEMVQCLNYMDEDAAMEYLGINSDNYTKENVERHYKFMKENKDKFFELFSELFYSLWD